MPNILKGTGSKEKNSPGAFKDNDNVPSWFKGSDLTTPGGKQAEVVVTGGKGKIEGERKGKFVKGMQKMSDRANPAHFKKGDEVSFSKPSKATGNMRTTTYTPTQDTQRTRTPGHTYAERNKYYKTETPVRITRTEIKPYGKK